MTNPARRAKHSGQSAFTYVAGSNYTIVLLTSRGNQLTFIINRGGPPPPPPTPAGESLSLDIYSFYNRTMAALNIRNIGNLSVSLVIYYVRDSAGSTYSNTAWIGPTEIAPNAVSPTDFDINTAGNHCGGCTLLWGSAFTFTPASNYTVIVITSRSNEFVFSVRRGFPFIPATPLGESLVLQSYTFSNSTSVALYLQNTGPSNVTLVSYYVRDSAGNTYSRTSWTPGPKIPASTIGVVYTNTGASCGSCTNQGSAFTFTAGSSYTIYIVTSKNNEFMFTVTRWVCSKSVQLFAQMSQTTTASALLGLSGLWALDTGEDIGPWVDKMQSALKSLTDTLNADLKST